MDDITRRSACDLLVELIGERNTTVLYNNTLRPFFCAEESAPAYANSGNGRAHRKLMVARELVTRCLAEERPARDVLTSPGLVRTYLQAHLSPFGWEVNGVNQDGRSNDNHLGRRVAPQTGGPDVRPCD